MGAVLYVGAVHLVVVVHVVVVAGGGAGRGADRWAGEVVGREGRQRRDEEGGPRREPLS